MKAIKNIIAFLFLIGSMQFALAQVEEVAPVEEAEEVEAVEEVEEVEAVEEAVELEMEIAEVEEFAIREIMLEDFNTLEVNGINVVEIYQSDRNVLVVKGPEEVIKEYEHGFSNGKLTIITQELSEEVEILVEYTDLDLLLVNGTSVVRGQNTLKGDKFQIKTNGASDIKLNIEVADLDVKAEGASAVRLSGTANNTSVDLGGACAYKADELATKKTFVKTSGASQAVVNVTDTLYGNAKGVSVINYVEEPQFKDVEVSSMANSGIYSGEEEQVIDDIEIDIEGLEELTEAMEIIEEAAKERKKKFNGHWGGVDLGINSYLNADNTLDLPEGAEFLELKIPNSLVVNLNLFEANFPIIGEHFGLVSGVGFEFNNYKFKNSNFLRKDSGMIVGEDAGFEFIKSKLSCTYFKIPLLLEFQTNSGTNRKSFHITAGAAFGVRIGAHSKYKYEFEGANVKRKSRNDHYLNPYRAEAIFKIGWNNINIFAQYSLLPLFEEGKGPELYPISVGLTLVNWG